MIDELMYLDHSYLSDTYIEISHQPSSAVLDKLLVSLPTFISSK